jgi:DNA-binding FadR family transcriptional regulator
MKGDQLGIQTRGRGAARPQDRGLTCVQIVDDASGTARRSDVADADADAAAEQDVRDALASHAAGMAATRRTDADLAELALANDQMAREIDAGGDGAAGADRFHVAVLAAAASPLLTRLLARAGPAAEPHPRAALRAHRLIYEAIAHGERDEAAWLMLEHVATDGALNAHPRRIRGLAAVAHAGPAIA